MTDKRSKNQFYAGFVDGQIRMWHIPIHDQRGIEIFTNKKTARKHYEDVRLIEIREVKAAKSRRRSS